jgi:hypothetical protein
MPPLDQRILAALCSMVEQAGFEILETGEPYFVPFGSRYTVPRLGRREVLARLTSTRGWEELVLYRRGIANAALRCRPLRG